MNEDEAIFHLLGWLDLEQGNRTLDEIVAFASEHSFPIILSRAEMEHTAQKCLAQGWIKVLTFQDCEDDRRRWVNDPHQNWSESGYHPGRVDFTEAGWTAFAALAEGQAKRTAAEAPPAMIRCLWRAPGCVSILSLSEQQLREELAAVKAGKDELTGGSLSAAHTVGEIVGPYPIGPWWVKRFVQSSVGYRLDVFFAPPDMSF